MLFNLLNRLKIRSISGFKAVVALFDVGSILLLMTLLASMGLARERVLIYAWNPLVIYELAGSGHLEGFVLFFVLLSLFLLVKGRTSASVSSLALAASVKLYPVILLPAFLGKKKLRGCLLFCVIFLLTYLPYLGVGEKIVGFLPKYLEDPGESFNLGLKAYLIQLFPKADPIVFTWVFAVFLLCVAGFISAKQKDAISALKFSYYLVSLQIVFTSASLHPWYVIWVIPFLALVPSPAWFYFSFAVCFSYLAYGLPGEILPEWVRNTEYIPFFLLLGGEFFILNRQVADWFPLRFQKEERAFALREID